MLIFKISLKKINLKYDIFYYFINKKNGKKKLHADFFNFIK